MRRFIFLLLVQIYLTVSLFAIDEYKTDVYFISGIKTEEWESKKVAEKILEPEIIETIYGNDIVKFNKDLGEIHYEYSHTYNSYFLEGSPDMIETLLQKLGLQGVLDWLVSQYDEMTVTAHEADLSRQKEKYRESIINGHKVLAIAYSQGTIFTYEAYRELDSWMQNYFEVVSVGSVGHFSIKDETPISWDNDIVASFGLYGNKIENPISKISWEPVHPDGQIVVPNVPKPTSNYILKENVRYTFEGEWKAVESISSGFDRSVHVFEFYMGKDLIDKETKEIAIDPFSKKPLSTDKAKDIIMKEIETKDEKNIKNSSKFIAYTNDKLCCFR